jgi:hypothetical protein
MTLIPVLRLNLHWQFTFEFEFEFTLGFACILIHCCEQLTGYALKKPEKLS